MNGFKVNYFMSCRKVSCSTCPGSRHALLLLTASDIENMRSLDTLVAGMGKYLLASWASKGRLLHLALASNGTGPPFGPESHLASTLLVLVVAVNAVAGLEGCRNFCAGGLYRSLGYRQIGYLCSLWYITNFCASSTTRFFSELPVVSPSWYTTSSKWRSKNIAKFAAWSSL